MQEPICRRIKPSHTTSLTLTLSLTLTKKEQQALKLDVEKTAKRCSHYIFWHRYQKHWEPKPPLDVSKWSAPIDVSWSA